VPAGTAPRRESDDIVYPALAAALAHAAGEAYREGFYHVGARLARVGELLSGGRFDASQAVAAIDILEAEREAIAARPPPGSQSTARLDVAASIVRRAGEALRAALAPKGGPGVMLMPFIVTAAEQGLVGTRRILERAAWALAAGASVASVLPALEELRAHHAALAEGSSVEPVRAMAKSALVITDGAVNTLAAAGQGRVPAPGEDTSMP
jgi:hypothetical protein